MSAVIPSSQDSPVAICDAPSVRQARVSHFPTDAEAVFASAELPVSYRTYVGQFNKFCSTHYAALPIEERYLVTEEKLYQWLVEVIMVRRAIQPTSRRKAVIHSCSGLGFSTVKFAMNAVSFNWAAQRRKGLNAYPDPMSNRIYELTAQYKRCKNQGVPFDPSSLQNNETESSDCDLSTSLNFRMGELRKKSQALKRKMVADSKERQIELSEFEKSQSESLDVVKASIEKLQHDMQNEMQISQQMVSRLGLVVKGIGTIATKRVFLSAASGSA